MALGSCGHRITHQLRPINMNGRSILAVTSIFEQLGANPVGGSIHLSIHCLSRLLLGIIKTSWHLIGTGRTARARGEACWRIVLRGWEPLPSLSLSMAAMAPVARLLERVTWWYQARTRNDEEPRDSGRIPGVPLPMPTHFLRAGVSLAVGDGSAATRAESRGGPRARTCTTACSAGQRGGADLPPRSRWSKQPGDGAGLRP